MLCLPHDLGTPKHQRGEQTNAGRQYQTTGHRSVGAELQEQHRCNRCCVLHLCRYVETIYPCLEGVEFSKLGSNIDLAVVHRTVGVSAHGTQHQILGVCLVGYGKDTAVVVDVVEALVAAVLPAVLKGHIAGTEGGVLLGRTVGAELHCFTAVDSRAREVDTSVSDVGVVDVDLLKALPSLGD